MLCSCEVNDLVYELATAVVALLLIGLAAVAFGWVAYGVDLLIAAGGRLPSAVKAFARRRLKSAA